MSLLSRVNPINVLEEKQKFFQDFSYNPQFVYNDIPTKDDILSYGQPDSKIANKALKTVEKFLAEHKPSDLEEAEGKKLSRTKVEETITLFLKAHHIENSIKVVWSDEYISRATMTNDTLKLRNNATFRTRDLLGMLFHEIGTHALRRINYEQQPWFGKKKEYGFSPYLTTEEGLATIHAHLPKNIKIAYSTAIRYLAVSYSQNHGFSQLWKYISTFVSDLETCWMICVRQKRGMTDTSMPGGFTKDQVYFEGVLKVGNWMLHNNFDLPLLYAGKISIEDAEKAMSINPNFRPLLPMFYKQDITKYQNQVSDFCKINGIE